MRKLILLLAFVPFILSAQTPAPLVDLSKYHDDNRIKEMIDNNFTNITEGGYLIPVLKVDSIRTNAIYYTDTYFDDLRVPLTNTRINPALSEPVFEDAGDGTFAWGFDADADSAEALNFIAQIPHKYAEGTDLDAHLHWQPATTNAGDVVWKLYYTIANVDGSFTSLDSMRVVTAGSGTALKHQVIDFGSIDGSSTIISAIIKGYVVRCGEATDDDFTGIAYGLEIDFHYQVNAPGSREEYKK